MRPVPTWSQYYLDIAEAASKRSKDPSTQVGAVIVNADNRIVSLGYNGMPEGCTEGHMWSDKDDFVIHAEVNAVANAARTGVSVVDGSIYVTLPPCTPCSRSIVASGIRRVVFTQASYENRITSKPAFVDIYERSFAYLKRSGVELEMVI